MLKLTTTDQGHA